MSRIKEAFAKAKAQNRAAFIVYLTAGYPNENDFIKYYQKNIEKKILIFKVVQYEYLFEKMMMIFE